MDGWLEMGDIAGAVVFYQKGNPVPKPVQTKRRNASPVDAAWARRMGKSAGPSRATDEAGWALHRQRTRKLRCGGLRHHSSPLPGHEATIWQELRRHFHRLTAAMQRIASDKPGPGQDMAREVIESYKTTPEPPDGSPEE